VHRGNSNARRTFTSAMTLFNEVDLLSMTNHIVSLFPLQEALSISCFTSQVNSSYLQNSTITLTFYEEVETLCTWRKRAKRRVSFRLFFLFFSTRSNGSTSFIDHIASIHCLWLFPYRYCRAVEAIGVSTEDRLIRCFYSP
jgi:hypothetical protein